MKVVLSLLFLFFLIIVFLNFIDLKVSIIFLLSIAVEHSAFTPKIFTSLNIKGKTFILDVFPKTFPIETRVPFLIRYFKPAEIASPPRFSKIVEYFSFKSANFEVVRKFF